MCDSLGVFLELLQYSAFQDQWLNTGGRTNAGLYQGRARGKLSLYDELPLQLIIGR